MGVALTNKSWDDPPSCPGNLRGYFYTPKILSACPLKIGAWEAILTLLSGPDLFSEAKLVSFKEGTAQQQKSSRNICYQISQPTILDARKSGTSNVELGFATVRWFGKSDPTIFSQIVVMVIYHGKR